MAQSSPKCRISAFGAACRLVTAVTLLAITGLPVNSATRTEKAFGNWAVVCIDQEKEGKSCSMMQSHVQPIKDTNRRNLVLRWAISINKNGEQTQSLVVPTGVSIKDGVRLFLGDAAPTVIAYSFCGPRVCLATTPVDAKLAAGIKASSKASASYVRGSKQLVQVPLDLKGFGEAYDFIVQQLS
jgi:invasion protein IalB